MCPFTNIYQFNESKVNLRWCVQIKQTVVTFVGLVQYNMALQSIDDCTIDFTTKSMIVRSLVLSCLWLLMLFKLFDLETPEASRCKAFSNDNLPVQKRNNKLGKCKLYYCKKCIF